MRSVNSCILVGRLGADQVVKVLGSSNKVATLNVATSDSYKDQSGEWKEDTQWHNVQVWGKSAEYCENLKKGDIVHVEGKIKHRKYNDKDGVEKWVTEIHSYNVQLFDKYKPAGVAPAGQQQPQQRASAPAAAADQSDDLPF